MKYRDENTNLRSHINTLRSVLAVSVVVMLGLCYGWYEAKKAVRIHIPPDIRNGAIIGVDDVQPAHVYAFANTVFQLANHWENGQADYGMQLYKVSAYLTPPFLDSLKADLARRGKNGELAERSRTIQPLSGQRFEDRRVIITGDDTWIVWLDYNIREYVKGMQVKNVSVRYPLRVVRYETDYDANPWGLALDGFYADGPKLLKPSEPLPELPLIQSNFVDTP